MATTDWEGHPFEHPVCYDCLPDHLPSCEQTASIFAGMPLRDCTCPERIQMLRHAARACDCAICVAGRPQAESSDPIGEDDGRYTWPGSAAANRHRAKEERWYSALSKVPTLWPLEHELGERPKSNARTWRAHEEHLAACTLGDGRNDHLCDDPCHRRPRCRPTYLWIEEWPCFNAGLIADSPQLWDQFGSWQLLAEYRADFTFWMRRLPPLYKRLALLVAGDENPDGTIRRYSVDEIAAKLGIRAGKAEVRRAIKLLNGFLRRAALRSSFEEGLKELAALTRSLAEPEAEIVPLPVQLPPHAAA